LFYAIDEENAQPVEEYESSSEEEEVGDAEAEEFEVESVSSSDCSVDAEYDISGGGTGKEYALNLMDKKEQNWNKWC